MPGAIENAITMFQEQQTVRTVILWVVAAMVIITIIVSSISIGRTLITPTALKGGIKHDYDADQNTRGSISDFINASNGAVTLDTPMTQLSVATANYGGIFTEGGSWLNPWLGHVDPEAVRLQIEAGARAVIFDIWPDPANPAIPVVCAMKDVNEWSTLGWWRGHGLDKGVGQYSNWQMITRNKVPATDMINMACSTAFGAPAPNIQTGDPFFLILRLHGAMTIDYLNYLGDTVKAALGSHRMETQWDRMQNQGAICSAKLREFTGRGFVIVSPDIQPGYNSLPNTNTFDSFRTQFLTSRMAEVTNVLESSPNTVFFGLGNLDAIASATQGPCQTGGSAQTPAQAGFCIVQPTIGGTTVSNDDQFKSMANFQKARQVGAQFVAVNYFPPSDSDGVLKAVFDVGLFGKFSFKKGA